MKENIEEDVVLDDTDKPELVDQLVPGEPGEFPAAPSDPHIVVLSDISEDEYEELYGVAI